MTLMKQSMEKEVYSDRHGVDVLSLPSYLYLCDK